MTLRALVLPILLVFVTPTARVRSQKPDVAGFFSNMYASSRTGDIGGATIFISWAKVHNGLEERYYAFVQTAEGVPSEPVLAPVSVTGTALPLHSRTGSTRISVPLRVGSRRMPLLEVSAMDGDSGFRGWSSRAHRREGGSVSSR